MNINRLLNRKSILLSALFSFYIMIALKIDLPSVYEEGSVVHHFFLTMDIQRVTDFITAFGLFVLSLIALGFRRNTGRTLNIWSGVAAVFFAIFIPLGRVFRSYDGYWIIYANYVQIIKTVIVVTGYALMLYFIILILFRLMSEFSARCLRSRKNGAGSSSGKAAATHSGNSSAESSESRFSSTNLRSGKKGVENRSEESSSDHSGNSPAAPSESGLSSTSLRSGKKGVGNSSGKLSPGHSGSSAAGHSGGFVAGVSMNHSVSFSKKDTIADFIINHKFLFLLILLGISGIVFYFFYPGIVMGDTKEHIKEAFGIRLYGDSYFNYLYPDSSLTNMRPVLSTLYFKACMTIGKNIFGSYNSGLGIFVLTQVIAIHAAFWRVCCILAKKGMKGIYILILLLYLYLNPLIATLAFTMTKDTIYMAFILLFITEFYVIISGEGRLVNYLVTCISALISMAFKGDAFYTIVIVVLVYAIYSFVVKRPRVIKLFALLLPAALILVHVVWGSAVLPAMHVSPGKKNVQAAIPLQQVARYVIFHWDEVSEEERKAIDAVVDYDRIFEEYSPTYADNMIVLTRNFTDEQFSEFMKVWIKICARDPWLALTAWMHNKYEYFYMEDTTFYFYGLDLSNEAIDYLNEEGLELGGIDFDIHYPDTWVKGVREFIDNVWQSEESIPVWNIITLPALYMLLLIMITVYFFVTKNQKGKIFLLFPWIIFILTNAFSATNGHYSRYMYPVVVLIPIIFAMFSLPDSEKQK